VDFSLFTDAYWRCAHTTDAIKGIIDDNTLHLKFTPQSEIYDGILADLKKLPMPHCTGKIINIRYILYGGDAT